MDWQNLAPVIALVTLFLTILGVQGAMWWQLSSRIDALSTLLTDNLLVLSREIGHLKGSVYAPDPTSLTEEAQMMTSPTGQGVVRKR